MANDNATTTPGTNAGTTQVELGDKKKQIKVLNAIIAEMKRRGANTFGDLADEKGLVSFSMS